MFAIHEKAILEALRSLDATKRVATIQTLPKLFGDDLLRKYVADAPALYVVPGRIAFSTGQATMKFTVAGVVRNAGGHERARQGDGIDIGCDHLMLMALVALDGKRLGNCSWNAETAEMADDALFEKSGIAAVEIVFVGTPIDTPTDMSDAAFAELDDFTRMHADMDIPPHASDDTRKKWLQEPPDNTTGLPDAQLDVHLPGASTP